MRWVCYGCVSDGLEPCELRLEDAPIQAFPEDCPFGLHESCVWEEEDE